MKKSLFIFGFYALLFMSCNGCGEKKEMTDADVNRIQKGMIAENKKQHEREMKDIDHFIKKKEWPMTETKTGLNYWIYENGGGKQPIENDFAFISYKIYLLNDSLCYETSDADPKRIVVGHDNVETGLHEALQLMHVGDRAKLILPSHLAFGFTGDSGKIPQNASVVYDIHLLRIQ